LAFAVNVVDVKNSANAVSTSAGTTSAIKGGIQGASARGLHVAASHGPSIPAAPNTIIGTLVHVFKYEGRMSGLYRGATPTVIAMVPYGGFNFYIFERLKHLCLTKFAGVSGYRQDDQIILTVPFKLLCGGISGSIAQTVTYPLDVARRRMQLSMTSAETRKYADGLIKTLMYVYKDHGVVRGLYRGMSINYIRAAPMVAVSFSTYELIKQMLGIEVGISAS
jgi:solute carrier family 25 protein 16